MHRQSTPRTTDQDARPETQAQPRANVTASQQSVLNLQQGVGNSLTGQIVQRTAPVVRRAGDKLAFERAEKLDGLDDELAGQVLGVIEKERSFKQGIKGSLEAWKEGTILERDEVSKGAGTKIAAQKEEGVPKEIITLRQERNEAATIGDHKKTLAKYHDDVQEHTGWRWQRMKKELSLIKGINFDDEPRDGVIQIVGTESSKRIYTIYVGTKRFNEHADVGREDNADNVYTKRGYSPGTKPKEFVKDDNGVSTRRFVTRAVTIWHLASMFGLKFKPKPETDEAEVAPAHVGEGMDRKRLDAQLPRYTGEEIGGHSETFWVKEAAAYVPKGGAQKTDFSDSYTPRSPGENRKREKASPGKRTGFDFTTGYNWNRGKGSRMGLNERASMQVRNGSGPLQPFLSTASAQVDPRRPKVIRANKGERFDTGAENQGIVKVDLAKAKQLGIKIVNQHDDESHQHKIAWDRVYDPDDIKALSERVALAKKYVDYAQEVMPTEAELKVFSEKDRGHILAEKPELVLNTLYDKRRAPEELDEYIYSARKNREVLMDKIPLSCVTEIYISPDPGKWPDLSEDLKGQWLPFPKVQGVLKTYLRGSENEDEEHYENIQKMYTKASIEKRGEGATRS
jgi:hypothetical protein